MSGTPWWVDKVKGKAILIDGVETVLRDMYCVGCRYNYPNSDELVLVTDAGHFNTLDCYWEFPKRIREELGWLTGE